MELKDKTVLVTGSSKGIGKAIAIEFAKKGSNVVICSRNQKELEDAKQDIEEFDVKVLAVKTDLREEEQVKNLIDKTLEEFNGIDVLINNAGIGYFEEIVNLDTEKFDDVMNTNFRAVFLVCKHSLKNMYEKGNGHIVNISSLAGKNPSGNGSAYSSSKAALNMFTECLFLEAREKGVKVSYVMPGSVNTGFSSRHNHNVENILKDKDVAKAVVHIVEHEDNSLIRNIEISSTKKPY